MFETIELAEAIARSRQSGKWLIAYVEGDAADVRSMERNTWPDPTVSDCIRRHDVLLIKTAGPGVGVPNGPALVVYKDGLEKDRVEGGLLPWDFVGWLDGLATRGETYSERQALVVSERNRDMSERYRRAEALVEEDQFEEATRELCWLWSHMLEVDPPMSGVRSSYMANTISKLVGAYPPARSVFSSLRDAAERVGTPLAIGDWVVLNEILGEPEKTLAFFDSAKARTDVREVLWFASYRITLLLLERQRWSDAGVLVHSPLDELRFGWECISMSMREGTEDRRDEFVALNTASFRKIAARLNATLRAAGRVVEADAVLEEALRLDDSEALRAAIREFANRAGVGAPNSS